MAQKNVSIAGRRFVVNGDNRDRYFREYVPDEGVFADAPIAVASQCCPRDGTVLDVGANIGISTLAFAHIASKGRVIAFEPSSRNFTLLLSNIEANGLTNVSAVKAALSNVESTVTLLEDPEFMAGNRMNAEAGASSGESEDVEAVTLDAEVSRHRLQRIDLIKIDVEGHERQVLEGASSTLEKFRPPCVIEFNSYTLVYHQHVAPMDFLTYLQGIFPKVFRFDRRSYALRDLAGRDGVSATQRSDRFRRRLGVRVRRTPFRRTLDLT